MPTFSVVLVGTEIRITSENDVLIGFFAGRSIVAIDEESAVQAAKKVILEQWAEDGFKKANSGGDPDLELDSICKMGVFEQLFYRVPKRGYTFFSE